MRLRGPLREAPRRFGVFTCLLLGLWQARPVAAQSVTGTIREANGGPFISGGFVTLLDTDGEAIQADFTESDGAFTLIAPAAGAYQIRVERIGYARWTSESYRLAVGERITVQIEIPPEPVLLSALRVEVVGSCLDDPRQGAELAAAWDEARKALETAVWAERLGELTFTLTEYQRTLEPSSLAVREAESHVRNRVRLPPFQSVPVADLVESGYAILTPDSATYYAPDAAVLLSPEFQDTHCFGLRRAQLGETSVLGITFAPRGARSVVEIEGTLWLEEASGELQRVQLTYRNVPLPRGADRRLIGADLTFDRLPNGPFFVSEWWIRFPVAGVVQRVGTATSQDRRQAVLVAYRQTGGAVTNAYVGDKPVEAGGGLVTGVVHDSTAAAPLVGANIVMRDWVDAADFLPDPEPGAAPFSGVTDSAGGFAVVNVPDGVYAVRVDHPKLRAAGLRLEEHRVNVEDGQSPPMELVTPSQETIYTRVCPRSATDKPRGAVVGFVRDAQTGEALSGVEVEVLWRDRRITVSSTGDPQISDLSNGTGATSDDDGRFALCDVPAGEELRLRPREGGEEATLTLDERIVWRDLPVVSGPGPPERH